MNMIDTFISYDFFVSNSWS